MPRVLEKDEYESRDSVEAYDRMVSKYQPIVHNGFVERVAEYFSEGRILDVGAGTGQIVIELAKNGKFELTALDVSEVMLEKAKENVAKNGVGEKISFVLGDVLKTELSEKFDAVISFNVLHHFAGPHVFWQRLERFTKDEGSIFLEDLVRPPKLFIPVLAWLFGGFDRETRKQYRESLEASLSKAEWKMLQIEASKKRKAFLKRNFITHMSIMAIGESRQKERRVRLKGSLFSQLAKYLFYR